MDTADARAHKSIFHRAESGENGRKSPKKQFLDPSGPRGRWFKSSHSDHKSLVNIVFTRLFVLLWNRLDHMFDHIWKKWDDSRFWESPFSLSTAPLISAPWFPLASPESSPPVSPHTLRDCAHIHSARSSAAWTRLEKPSWLSHTIRKSLRTATAKLQ